MRYRKNYNPNGHGAIWLGVCCACGAILFRVTRRYLPRTTANVSYEAATYWAIGILLVFVVLGLWLYLREL